MPAESSPADPSSLSPATSPAGTPLSPLPVALPPFRSATEFPRAPRPEQLPALYVDCLQALQDANTARNIHQNRMQAKKQVITAVRLEITRLEQDLALEAGTRASLHAINRKLIAALQEMDGLVEDLDQLVQDGHRVPRSRLGRVIENLKALVNRWRAFKRRQHQEMASLVGSAQDGEA